MSALDLIKEGFANAIVCVVEEKERKKEKEEKDKCFFCLHFFSQFKISSFRDDFKW